MEPPRGHGLRNLTLGDATIDLVRAEIRRADREPIPLTPREIELIAYLARSPGRVVPRDELHAEVWQFSPRARTRAVDFTVHRLRSKLEPDPARPRYLVTALGAGFRLVVDPPEPAGDDERATVLAGHLHRRMTGWGADPRATAEALARLRGEVGRCADDHGGATSRRVPPLLAFADPGAALAAARRLLRADPTLGIGLATGAVRWWRGGDPPEVDGPAVVRAEALARGWQPGHAVMDHDTAEALPDLGVRDLGEVRLADLDAQVRAFVDRAGAPAFAHRPPGALRPVDALIGRAAALEAARVALATNAVVTVWGPAGVGKSRLALELAAEWAADGLGAAVCEVRSARTPHALRLGVSDAVGVGADSDRLEAAIRARGGFLLVIDGADALCAEAHALAARITHAAPACRALVTSRVRAKGDRTSPAVVALDELGIDDAIALLVDRAEPLRPGFGADRDAVRALAQRVGGSPLALTLVAARAALRSPAQLARSLQEGAATATLQDTVAWSFALLEPTTLAVLERLSVFPGPFSLDDAAWVVPDLADGLADRLSDLRDSALLRDVPPGRDDGEHELRLAAYDPVRELGRTRLRAAGGWRDAVDRHAAVFLDRAERLLSAQHTAAEPASLRALARDLPDLLAIEARAAERQAEGDRDALAIRGRAVTAAVAPLLWRGPQELAVRLLEPLVAAVDRLAPAVAIRVLRASGQLAAQRRDRVVASARFGAWRALAERIGDPAEVLRASADLAHLHPDPAQIPDRERWIDALAELGRPSAAAVVCNHLMIDFRRRDPARARAWFERGTALARSAGYRLVEAMLQMNHGTQLGMEPGRAADGASFVLRAVHILREIGNDWLAVRAQSNAGYLLALGGEVLEGRGLLELSLDEADAIGDALQHALITAQLADVALLTADLAAARRLLHAALAAGRARWMPRAEAEAVAAYAGLGWAIGGGGAVALDDFTRAVDALARHQEVDDWHAARAALLAADGRIDEARDVLASPALADSPHRELAVRVVTSLAAGDRAAAVTALRTAPRAWGALRLAAWLGAAGYAAR